MKKTSTAQPTVEQWVEHGARHYSPALDDADYFRTKFRALRECLAHAFPDRPLGSMKFGAEDTPVGRCLDEYAEHLLRACGNSAYWDNGEMSDLLFHWHETFPLVRDYLARRGLAKGILDELARIETDQQAKDFRQLIRKALDADTKQGKQGGFTDKDRKTLEQCAADARAARTRKDGERRNGRKQANNIQGYNAEQANTAEADARKKELKKAVESDKRDYPDPTTERPKGYWKDLRNQSPSFSSADALRKAVMRERQKKRGRYEREGKKRGPYRKRI